MNTGTAIFTGAIGSILAGLFFIFCRWIRPYFSKLHKFELTGSYVASFDPKIPKDSKSVEIVSIKHKDEAISIKLENYNSQRNEILNAEGIGKFRLSNLAVVYYCTERSIPSLGSMVLRHKIDKKGNTLLMGNYFQYVDASSDDISGQVLKVPYVLYRVDFPIWKIIISPFLKMHFNSYSEAREWFDSHNF